MQLSTLASAWDNSLFYLTLGLGSRIDEFRRRNGDPCGCQSVKRLHLVQSGIVNTPSSRWNSETLRGRWTVDGDAISHTLPPSHGVYPPASYTISHKVSSKQGSSTLSQGTHPTAITSHANAIHHSPRVSSTRAGHTGPQLLPSAMANSLPMMRNTPCRQQEAHINEGKLRYLYFRPTVSVLLIAYPSLLLHLFLYQISFTRQLKYSTDLTSSGPRLPRWHRIVTPPHICSTARSRCLQQETRTQRNAMQRNACGGFCISTLSWPACLPYLPYLPYSPYVISMVQGR